MLKNDVGNLLILLLQAPIIGLVLFLLTAPGTFGIDVNSDSVVHCQSRPSSPYHSCAELQQFLDSPQGDAYAQSQGKSKAELLDSGVTDGGGNAETTLFIMAFAAVMFGCINGAREIVKEAPIYHRERTVNLGIGPYMFSKITVLGVLCLAQSLVLTAFVSARATFPHNTLTALSPFLEIYITMALTSLAGLMLGLTVSALVPNNDRAMSIVPLILIPQVIFSGIIFKLSGPVLQFLAAFFPARWAMAAMGSSVGLHGRVLNLDSWSFQGTLYSQYTENQGPAIGHLLLCWFFLVVTILVLGGLVGYFLKQKDVRS